MNNCLLLLARITAKVGTKKIPTRKKFELGIVLGILELFLEFPYDLMPIFCIK